MSEAQKAAATGGVVKFTYEEHEYTIDPDALTLDVAEHAEGGRVATATRLMLGDEQYAAYKERHPKLLDLDPFYRAAMDAISAGNSSASRGS